MKARGYRRLLITWFPNKSLWSCKKKKKNGKILDQVPLLISVFFHLLFFFSWSTVVKVEEAAFVERKDSIEWVIEWEQSSSSSIKKSLWFHEIFFTFPQLIFEKYRNYLCIPLTNTKWLSSKGRIFKEKLFWRWQNTFWDLVTFTIYYHTRVSY